MLSKEPVYDDPKGLYYVQDSRQYVGNCVYWWARDHKGYTCHLENAHVFTAQEARKLHAERDTDVPWSKARVDAAASLQVDAQRLARQMEQVERMQTMECLGIAERDVAEYVSAVTDGAV